MVYLHRLVSGDLRLLGPKQHHELGSTIDLFQQPGLPGPESPLTTRNNQSQTIRQPLGRHQPYSIGPEAA